MIKNNDMAKKNGKKKLRPREKRPRRKIIIDQIN
jgi:hypothetical protein